MPELFKSPPDGSRIVSMVQFQDTLYIATEQSIYRLVDGEWQIIMFEQLPEEQP